jgi:hypothetical protein
MGRRVVGRALLMMMVVVVEDGVDEEGPGKYVRDVV